jgi:hypothetical protein
MKNKMEIRDAKMLIEKYLEVSITTDISILGQTHNYDDVEPNIQLKDIRKAFYILKENNILK